MAVRTLNTPPKPEANSPCEVAVEKHLELAVLAPVEQNKLIKSFEITAADLYEEPDAIVDWQGTKLLEHLVDRGTSCIVFSERGGGKATAAAGVGLAEDVNTRYALVLEPNLPSIYLNFWQECGMLIKGLKIARDQGMAVCQGCKEHCIIKEKTELYLKPDAEDLQDFLISEAGVRQCQFIKKTVDANLKRLPRLILLDLPYVDKTEVRSLVSLLCRLLHSHNVIILADNEQLPWLEIDELKLLQRVPFPRAPFNLLLDIIKQRVNCTGIGKLPISEDGLRCLALLTNGNPRKLLETLNLVLMLLSYQGLISTQDILNQLGPQLDEESMVNLAIAQIIAKNVAKAGDDWDGWVSVVDLQDEIYDTFLRNIRPERIGRYLCRLRLNHRRVSKGEEYFLNNKTAHRLLLV